MSMKPEVELVECDTGGSSVLVYRVVDHEPLSEHLCALAYERRRLDPTGIDYQADTTWHSKDDLHELDALAPLRAAFDAALTHAWERARWSPSERPWEYTAMWGNIASHGGYAAPHAHWGHARSMVGGVYYSASPAGAGALRLFSPDRRLSHVGGVALDTLAPFARPSWFDLTPTTGQLVLIPAWVGHSVRPNLSLRDRISWTFLAAVAGFDVDWPQTPELPDRQWAPPLSGSER